MGRQTEFLDGISWTRLEEDELDEKGKRRGRTNRRWRGRKKRENRVRRVQQGSHWAVIWRYLLLVVFGGVLVWVCSSAGISVYADGGEMPEGAELIRFDFHKSVNQEVGIPAGIPGFFTYFYEGKEYHYGFRFDRNGTGPETDRFETAYVWAPYTVIYYDAAGGEIENYGTATAGGKRLFATRGNGEELNAKQNRGKSRRKFAADYTVYGQDLLLSEGCMPTARREGYEFKGWYAWVDAEIVQEEAAAELAKREQYGTLEERLNEKYTEQTKLLENRESERYPAAKITLYAKWDKIWE